jgi:putative phosphoribosyl transferase
MDLLPQPAEQFRERDVLDEERIIPADETLIKATLNVPHAARGVVALLHTHGGRFGQEGRFAGEVFAQAGLATLQIDLLTPEEDAALSNGRDPEQYISLLLGRVMAALDWLGNQRETAGLPIGLFASTQETIPALLAAERSPHVLAVVSRGGCPDFGKDAVGELRARTLLLLGHEEQARAAELASEFFARQLTSSS